MAKSLTARELRYVDAYMTSGNGTQSAIAAGYSQKPGSAAVFSSRLLKKVQIQEAIAARQANDPRVADRKERQEFWTTVLRSSEQAMRDRLKASELLGRSGLDFVEHVQVNGGASLDVTVTHQHLDAAAVKVLLDEKRRLREAGLTG